MDKKELKAIILKTLEKEGGAAGIKALAKAAKTPKNKLKKDLDDMSGVKQHKHGDYISTPLSEVRDIIEVMIDEKKKKKKKDRCHRKADSVYGTKTSAYKSGAIVKCRKGMIWKKKKNEDAALSLSKKNMSSYADKNELKVPYRKSGYMGYSEPVNEQEEEKEYSKDVEALEKIIDSKINTKDEWVDMFQLLMAHSEEIQGLSGGQIKSLLQQSLKDI